jgi:hypothetical protein
MTEKYKDLSDCYNDYIKKLGHLAKYKMRIKIIEAVIKSPAPRFYVSVQRALRFVSKIESGEKLPLSELHYQMYKDIRDNYLLVKEKGQFKNDIDIINAAINLPAPRWYMTIGSAIVIFNKIEKIKYGKIKDK